VYNDRKHYKVFVTPQPTRKATRKATFILAMWDGILIAIAIWLVLTGLSII
jgi:hypothetical protein